MKLPFLISMEMFLRKPAPKPPTVHQAGIQARAIRHLIAHGSIDARTVFMMGTTDAHKMFTRMRRLGLLYDANDHSGHDLLPNRSGSGRYRRHRWTGKLPLGWLVEERRSKPRGGKQ